MTGQDTANASTGASNGAGADADGRATDPQHEGPQHEGPRHEGPPDAPQHDRVTETERLRRWRLLLGAPAGPGLGAALNASDQAADSALAALYENDRPGRGSARTTGSTWRHCPAP